MKSKTSYRMLLTCILVSSLILFNGCGHKDEGDEHAGHGNEAEERHGEHGNGHEEGVHEGEGHDEHEEGVVALTKKAAEMISLKLDSVEKRVIKKKLPITGEISRDFEKSFHVSAEVPGVITRLKARLGDNVQKGSVLAEVKAAKTER